MQTPSLTTTRDYLLIVCTFFHTSHKYSTVKRRIYDTWKKKQVMDIYAFYLCGVYLVLTDITEDSYFNNMSLYICIYLRFYL